jgi:electron transfer flavoprotein alpha subunit
VNRLRIERRRPLSAPGGRLRRDPRAERAQPVPPAEAGAPSGRLRRDPRAARGAQRQAEAPEQKAPSPGMPRIAIENPACLILAVPDLEEGRFSSHDRDLMGAARLLADASKGAVVVLAPEGSHEDFATAGADRLVHAGLPAGYLPEEKTAAVLAAIEALQPRHVLFCETPTGGGDIGRRVAASLGEALAVRVVRLSPDEASSRIEGGRRELLRPPQHLMLIAPETADPPSGSRWEARLLPSPRAAAVSLAIEDRGIMPTNPNALPLAEAEFIVAAGNGVTDWANFRALAAALGAAEGASRVVCDAGLMPRERQVGASGSLVEPRCYLAFGIAGAPQHLQGIARCERVLAVNTDLHAEMVKRADLAIIADAQAVMPALLRLAKEKA